MSSLHKALRHEAQLLIRSARVDLELSASARHIAAQRACMLAAKAGDPVLEAEALRQFAKTFAPPVDPVQTLQALRQAQGIYVANGLQAQAAACRVAEAQLLADIGEERHAIAVAQHVLAQTSLQAEDRAHGLILVGLCHSHLGELDFALRLLKEKALPAAEACAGTALPAQVHWALGLTCIRLLIWHRHPSLWRGWPGMPPILAPAPSLDEVVAPFERAQALLPPGQRWRYIEMGYHFALGLGPTPGPALRELARLAAAQRAGDPPLAARALYCLGMIMRRHGQPAKALAAFKGALAVAEPVRSLAIVSDVLLQLSRVHEDLGDAAQALACYKRFSVLQLKRLVLPPQTAEPDGAALWQPALGEPSAPPAPATPLRNLEPVHLRRALRFISGGGGGPMTVQDVTQHCGVSRRTLESAFRQYKGDSIMGCIKRLQMEVAAERLQRTTMRVHEVAAMAGYRSQAAFAREFGRHFGSSPMQWRRARGLADAAA